MWEHLIITNRKAKITELNVCVRARPLRTANKNTPATQNEWLPLSTWKKKSIPHFCPSSRCRHTLKMSRTHIHSNTFTFIYEGLWSSWFCWVFQICNHYNNTSTSFLYIFLFFLQYLSIAFIVKPRDLSCLEGFLWHRLFQWMINMGHFSRTGAACIYHTVSFWQLFQQSAMNTQALSTL